MKQAEHSNSETEHLIDRAFERDLQRLPEPPATPSARLLQKLAATPHLPVAHSFGWLGSVTAKWLIVLALGSATAGVAYFALHTNSHSSSASSSVPSPRGMLPPVQRPPSVSAADTTHSMAGTADDRSSAVPSLKPPMLPKSVPAITPHRNARTAISEDSLLREEIAHPTITLAPDSAKTTIHTREH
ncbi:MAG TPA: hypothetical protein VFH95_06665 [Candidatus Kapabacteria bacterium]|nr:hypothetical protein [Candidatus Kapabacteria bacterium]